MLKRLVMMVGMIGLLAACNNNSNPSQPVSDSNVIQWDRNPNTIVFRSDITSGSTDPFLTRSEIPHCTIYGDNRAVWTNELGPFNTQVLEDRLTDDQIRNFVSYLAINKEFYKYQARADRSPAEAVQPAVETLTLFVNGVDYKTDAFGGWNLDYYDEVTRVCREISLAPVLLVPKGGWLSAKLVPYSSQAASVYWDPAANALSVAEIATSSERKWITDRNAEVIWNLLRESPPSVQLVENQQQFQIAFEVPNVTRDSPPAPQ
jgi:hypothetical protein